MTPHEEHWRHIFLNAYKTHTGDARRLALNEAWFDFAKSDDYYRIGEPEDSTIVAYWTALVDAAHVEQEQSPQLWDSPVDLTEYLAKLRSSSPPPQRMWDYLCHPLPTRPREEAKQEDDTARIETLTKPSQATISGQVGYGGAGGGTGQIVAKRLEDLLKNKEELP